MASIRTKFTVGLFVALGGTIAIATIIGLGMSHFLEKGKHYLAYFDESVQGLDKDSEVLYRGVSIGRVKSIEVAPDATLIETILKIEADIEPIEELFAQLKSAGITGKMYVELDRKRPGEKGILSKPSFPTEMPIIPTKPSEIKRLLQSLDDAFTNINSMDIQGLSDRMMATLDSINAAVEDADIRAISKSAQRSMQKIEKILDELHWAETMQSIKSAADSIDVAADSFTDLSNDTRGAVYRIDTLIADSETNLREAIAELKLIVENANHLVKGADNTVQMLGQNLETTLQNVEEASNHLNRTLELIADQPSQLVFGEPPRPRELP